jgi:hypothetical protein
MVNREILEDLLKDSPCKKMGVCNDKEGNWCFLRDFVLSTGIGNRNIEQLRLMYDYKFMQSKKEGYDIGKERAFKEFIMQYGERFAELYKEGMTNGQLFQAVFGFEKKHTDEDLREHIANN